MKRKVIRVDPSPMNPKRWVLELECGHEIWVTANQRPKRQNAKCDKCKGAKK